VTIDHSAHGSTVSGKKKRPQYSRHNFDKFRHSLAVFGVNRRDTSTY